MEVWVRRFIYWRGLEGSGSELFDMQWGSVDVLGVGLLIRRVKLDQAGVVGGSRHTIALCHTPFFDTPPLHAQ